ncbi:MAG: hypothetical protein YHS30scaffold324_20 [Catenulispora phage 69_17]|jgi:hypothetical protein|nr:MAG: hypothetical protein YHS30scaffold324_20 [Catenulispora phage 69_17]
MSEPSVLIVRDDGVIPVPNGIPVVHGLVEAVEHLFNSLGIPTREETQQPKEEDR